MEPGDNWKCPYCGHAQVIARERYFAPSLHDLPVKNWVEGRALYHIEAVVCANTECRKLSLEFAVKKAGVTPTGRSRLQGTSMVADKKEPSHAYHHRNRSRRLSHLCPLPGHRSPIQSLPGSRTTNHCSSIRACVACGQTCLKGSRSSLIPRNSAGSAGAILNLVMAPVLKKTGCLRRDLPLIGIWQ
jgi:hypothetical protein